MDNYGYIYLTENLINGNCYIGKHKSNTYDKYYKGSGIGLKKAMSKHGSENFITTIIEWCNNFDNLNEREVYWIAKCKANKRKWFYNQTDGGDGFRGNHSEETKIKIREKLKGKDVGHRKGTKMSKETKEKLRQCNLGKKLSKETREKIVAAHRGKHWKMSEEGRQHCKEGHLNISDEYRQKMRDSHLGKKLPQEQKDKIGASVRRFYLQKKGVANEQR